MRNEVGKGCGKLIGLPLCAPGYTGRKRGEIVRSRTTVLQDGGSIILTASIGASKGQGGGTINGASKAAVRSFARAWTAELSGRKIRVNVVSPGPINTPMLNSMGETEEQTKQILAGIATTVPMKRLGDPDEVVKAVLFLASDDSSFVTGIELFVNGGVAQI